MQRQSLGSLETVMQRQSLGSPSSKPTGAAAEGKEERRRSGSGGGGVAVEEEELKAEKPIKPARSTPEPSIHLIPVLTLLCLLVLYLCSHDPSPSDLASVGGTNRVLGHRAAVSGGDAGRWMRLESGSGGGVAALHSHRGLKEAARLHRKLRILSSGRTTAHVPASKGII